MAKPEKSTGSALSRLAARAAAEKHQEAPTVHIPLDKIDFDPNQPRIAFHAPDGLVAKTDEDALAELAGSIRVNGLIHPITVSEKPDGRYLVRVGERRTRAYKLNAAEFDGAKTIEARVRNDLRGMRALALQMAENTDREPLTDLEIALTIQRFITKSEENPEPMTKKEVAEFMGKSAGWVTRYLAFGDEALRAKWVTPGYIATVENLYMMTTLPKAIQELAYADLSTGKMEAPLSYQGMQYYRNLAKKQASAAQGGTIPAANPGATQGAAPMVPGSSAQVAAIAAALGGAGADGVVSGAQAAGSEDGGGSAWPFPVVNSGAPAEGMTVAGSQDGYSLPPAVANDLRKPTYQAPEGGAPAAVRSTPGMMTNTAVPCRMPMKMLSNLIAKYGADIAGMDKIEAEFRIPSALAVDLVHKLTGETVAEDRVQVVLAKALESLR